MSKILTEHIHLAYELGKKVFSKSISLKQAADELVQLGMNKNSAEMYVTFYLCLRRGTVATRDINLEALNYFLSRILQEETTENFVVAMKSFKDHIDWYQKEFKKPIVGRLKIYHQFESDLSQSAVLYFDETEPLSSSKLSEAVYLEGARKTITVNAYERNPKARKACLNHYGYQCQVCGFDFERQYGSIGENFIHVHHREDLACIDAQYQVNPIEDLVPVCANCHAMLHQKKPAYSVDELKSILMQHEVMVRDI